MSVAVGGPVRSSSVGAAFRSPMMMVGARREGRRYARLKASKKFLGFLPESIRALQRRDIRIASGWRQDSVGMMSGWRQDGVRLASGWRQDDVRMLQNAVRMLSG